jgi:rhamnosyltransferase
MCISAVIVTYHPDPLRLENLLACLHAQGLPAIVVDNSVPSRLASFHATLKKSDSFALFPLGRNVGLAAAQNIGIKAAQKTGASYVLLLDQDSLPEENMLTHLVNAIQLLEKKGHHPAAVGPVPVDGRTAKAAPQALPIKPGKGFEARFLESGEIMEVDHLISSGCLLSLEAFTQIGEMDEALFIDYVDIEWCLRARLAGYEVFAVEEARLFHHLGERILRLFGRDIPMHSPLRHYYLIRNGVYLQRKATIPTYWKKADRWLLLKRFVFYSVFSWPPGRHFGHMLRGLFDGLRGKMGPFSPRM